MDKFCVEIVNRVGEFVVSRSDPMTKEAATVKSEDLNKKKPQTFYARVAVVPAPSRSYIPKEPVEERAGAHGYKSKLGG